MTDSSTFDRNHPRVVARRAMNMVRALARAAGDGLHHLTVMQPTPVGVAEAECIITGPVFDESDESDPLTKVAYLLATTSFGVGAVLIARTLDGQGDVRFMSWMVRDVTAYPATASQSVIAYCMSEDRDLTDPVRGVTFVDAPSLG
ncbi:hypothetical protein ABZ667_43120 [Streptomyces lavendulae]|uniref:hypothetical protein n=1 Tax=Streptomyces lavendulae TaxID=1914 RepID=UPI0024A5F317|nr:hypothetical protein [Streptomyces lavendulae]GLW04718.1 hypothetical protein Slala05_83480 [Streptomyces lavendulae subsp. lavendulae]